MSESNIVEMNIPRSNPLYWWTMEQRWDKPIEYATLTVGDIETRLALVEVPTVCYRHDDDPDEETFLVTRWRLYRSQS